MDIDVIVPRCPKCRHNLSFARVTVGKALACSGCRGMWLDNDACRKLVDGVAAREVLELARRLDEEAEGTSSDPAATPYRGAIPSDRVCPFCARPLQRSVAALSRAALDLCAEHGTFFDPSELRAVDDAARARKWELDVREDVARLQNWAERFALDTTRKARF